MTAKLFTPKTKELLEQSDRALVLVDRETENASRWSDSNAPK
ncbi:hypothetical protein [Chlorogloeopsis sp. ULAP02]